MARVKLEPLAVLVHRDLIQQKQNFVSNSLQRLLLTKGPKPKLLSLHQQEENGSVRGVKDRLPPGVVRTEQGLKGMPFTFRFQGYLRA